MDSLCAAPLAPLLKLDLALDELLVFGRPIVNTLTLGAGEADESILRHNANYYNLQGYFKQAKAFYYCAGLKELPSQFADTLA